MASDRIAWHPGFASAIQLELKPYGDCLAFETEHELNREPLRIDLLVVKKDPAVRIDNAIASTFRGHNVMEFKSEQDSLSIDDLYKTLAYGCLYKAYGPTVNAIRADDVTVTLVRHQIPRGLFKELGNLGHEVVSYTTKGVYDLAGLLFPVRVLVTSELDPSKHIWLTSLASNLEALRIRKLVDAASAIDDTHSRALADALLNVVTLANTDAIERLKEEDAMGKTLYEIMQPEIDEAIAKAREEAIRDGLEKGRAQGLEQGRAQGLEKGLEQGKAVGREEGVALGARQGRLEAIRAMVRRLLERGGFADEEIAELAGTDLEQVRAVAASMQTTPA